MPWTIHQILADSKHKTYDDAIPDAEQMPECVDPGEDQQETQGEPRRRLRHKAPPPAGQAASSGRLLPRGRELRKKHHGDRGRSRSPVAVAEANLEPRPKQPKTSNAEAHVMQAVGIPRRLPREHELSRSPCNYWQQENAAISRSSPSTSPCHSGRTHNARR